MAAPKAQGGALNEWADGPAKVGSDETTIYSRSSIVFGSMRAVVLALLAGVAAEEDYRDLPQELRPKPAQEIKDNAIDVGTMFEAARCTTMCSLHLRSTSSGEPVRTRASSRPQMR